MKKLATPKYALPMGFTLEEYIIEGVLGSGGFGITYLAKDRELDAPVVLKEYFPLEFAVREADGFQVAPSPQGDERGVSGDLSYYQWGLERFLQEARVLARVRHPHVVRVNRHFRAQGTGYIVMDYEAGSTLDTLLAGGILDEADVWHLLKDALSALQAVHGQGYLHRDIKPSNLYIRARDSSVMLIDFGSARAALNKRTSGVTVLISRGYSPPEQYADGESLLGPWTDLYALGAVLYFCMLGEAPPDASGRLIDDRLAKPLRFLRQRYSQALVDAVERAMALKPEVRFQSVDQWLQAIAQASVPDPGSTAEGPQSLKVRLDTQLGGRELPVSPPSSVAVTKMSGEDAQGPIQWDTSMLLRAELLLERYVGTAAQEQMRAALREAKSADDFFYLLSQGIDDARQRLTFIEALTQG
ncbi:MAG: serine/threonine protein kinase, partial [Candidatus Competibacterales bacterium]